GSLALYVVPLRPRLRAPSRLFPYTTLFRSPGRDGQAQRRRPRRPVPRRGGHECRPFGHLLCAEPSHRFRRLGRGRELLRPHRRPDRKSTRLNSSHVSISYAVFCLKKKKPGHARTDDGTTPGSHAHVAGDSSPFWLVTGRLTGNVRARTPAHATYRNLLQNLFFAFL